MRFMWPRFIPSNEVDSFFQPVRHNILARLRTQPILESLSGKLASPSDLSYVDERFTDKSGKPLTLCDHTKNLYLSSKYPDHVLEFLRELGVSKLSDEQFVEHLKRIILEHEGQFRGESLEWHSKLAEALIPLVEKDELEQIICTLPLIPIADGHWVAATSKPRIFSDAYDLGDLRVLKSTRIIHPAAISDANRSHLWASLGLQAIDRGEICQYIVRAHEQPLLAPHKSWSRAHLVAHAKFLFKSGWRPSKPVDLWVETSLGERC